MILIVPECQNTVREVVPHEWKLKLWLALHQLITPNDSSVVSNDSGLPWETEQFGVNCGDHWVFQRWLFCWLVRKPVVPECQSRAILSSGTAVFLFSFPHRNLC